MVRAILAVTMFAAACGSAAGPAVPDGGTSDIDAGRPPTGALGIPVGAACDVDDSYFCASYAGVCIESVCRAQCSAVDYPRCGGGSVEQVIVRGDGGRQCYCVPM